MAKGDNTDNRLWDKLKNKLKDKFILGAKFLTPTIIHKYIFKIKDKYFDPDVLGSDELPWGVYGYE